MHGGRGITKDYHRSRFYASPKVLSAGLTPFARLFPSSNYGPSRGFTAPHHRLSRVGGPTQYHGITQVSLPPPLRATTPGLGLVTRYPLPGFLPWKRQDLPSSWGTPIPVCTWSPTPAGRCVPDQLRNARMAPARYTTKVPTRRIFRGSIAWLSGSPPTYHVSAQGWLPGAGRSPGRAFTRRVPTKGFNSLHVR